MVYEYIDHFEFFICSLKICFHSPFINVQVEKWKLILWISLTMPPASRKKQKNPLLRHNSEDDEMRFSGLHGKHDIPSKSFKMLQNLTVNDDDASSQGTQDDGEKSQFLHLFFFFFFFFFSLFSNFERTCFGLISTFRLFFFKFFGSILIIYILYIFFFFQAVLFKKYIICLTQRFSAFSFLPMEHFNSYFVMLGLHSHLMFKKSYCIFIIRCLELYKNLLKYFVYSRSITNLLHINCNNGLKSLSSSFGNVFSIVEEIILTTADFVNKKNKTSNQTLHVIYKRVVARKRWLMRRFSLFCLLNK